MYMNASTKSRIYVHDLVLAFTNTHTHTHTHARTHTHTHAQYTYMHICLHAYKGICRDIHMHIRDWVMAFDCFPVKHMNNESCHAYE